jgi:Amt family ammonium transporter
MLVVGMLLVAAPAAAQEEASGISAGDTAWVLVSAAFVMLMVPGLALFYGGMVRNKNVVSTLLQCFVIMALISVQWALIGYTLAFGTDHAGLIGGLDYVFLNNIAMGDAAPAAATIPHIAFVLFQAMFAAITPALIVGAFAERFSFKALIVFSLLWATFVYDPVAHWVWGGGFLSQMGALDFAGGTVVHITAGVAALASVLYIGHRRGFGTVEMRPNNIPLTVLGAGLLWFGWFGFNAGSALAAGPLAANAFAATHLAASAAALSWVGIEWARAGKPTAIGAATGLVAGLVAVTPAAGFVTPMGALVLGLVAGAVCYTAVTVLKKVFRVDDSLDAFGVHGVGGVWGSLATGLFATAAVSGGATGLLATPDGGLGLNAAGLGLVWTQTLAVLITAGYAFVVTLGILWVTDVLVGLRVTETAEQVGLDLFEHGETAYDYEPVAYREPTKTPQATETEA